MGEEADRLVQRAIGLAPDDGIPYGVKLPARRPARDVAYWDSDAKWVTREGQSIALEDMSPRHRGHVVAMLERRSEMLRAALLNRHANKHGFDWTREQEDEYLAEARRLMDTPGVELVHSTPLVKRLIELGTE